MSAPVRVALGPQLPEFGSWQWLGNGLADWLQRPFEAERFADITNPPSADIVVFIKFLPGHDVLERVSQASRIVFFPVDVFGSCRELDECHHLFEYLSKVVVHSPRLERYFASYCDVEFLDHPLKFVTETPRRTSEQGPIVWIGRRCNLAPVADWANHEALGRELWILTNLEDNQGDAEQAFNADVPVCIDHWTAGRHLEYLQEASVAVDIKGDDFRARHKPPAKSIDFLASGIPLITNRGSSVDMHFQDMGVQVLYVDSWQEMLNDHHRSHCATVAEQIRNSHSPEVVWGKMTQILHDLI